MAIHRPMVLRVEMMAIGRGNLCGRLSVFNLQIKICRWRRKTYWLRLQKGSRKEYGFVTFGQGLGGAC